MIDKIFYKPFFNKIFLKFWISTQEKKSWELKFNVLENKFNIISLFLSFDYSKIFQVKRVLIKKCEKP